MSQPTDEAWVVAYWKSGYQVGSYLLRGLPSEGMRSLANDAADWVREHMGVTPDLMEMTTRDYRRLKGEMATRGTLQMVDIDGAESVTLHTFWGPIPVVESTS